MAYKIKEISQLGQAIKDLRAGKDLTQQEASARGGLLQKTVSSLESDPGKSSVNTLFKLLDALEVDIELKPRGAYHGKDD